MDMARRPEIQMLGMNNAGDGASCLSIECTRQEEIQVETLAYCHRAVRIVGRRAVNGGVASKLRKKWRKENMQESCCISNANRGYLHTITVFIISHSTSACMTADIYEPEQLE